MAMAGVGSTGATGLTDWYVQATGLTDNRRKLVGLVKKIVLECGGIREAKQVLALHLSSDWRRRNTPYLEHVVSKLDEYKRELGLENRAARVSVERGDGFLDVVFVPSLAVAEVGRG